MSLLEALGQGATVVTANDRIARHLRWRHDRFQAESDRNAWKAADILSQQAWLERLYKESVAVGGEAGRYDLLTREQSQIIWQSIIDLDDGAATGRGPARVAADAWRLCRAWRISVDDLHRAALAGTDSEVFARWARTFATRCRKEGWIDAPSLPDHLVIDVENRVIRFDAPVSFAGFDAPTAQQAGLIDAVSAMPLESELIDNTAPLRVKCQNPGDERELAARWARAALEKNPAAVLGIVLPDHGQGAGAWRRTCLDILLPDWRSRSRRALPVSTGRGESLVDQGIVHAALLVIRLIDRQMDYRDLGQLLRSPYLRGGIEEADGRASLDVWLRNQGRMDIDLRWLMAAKATNRLAPQFAVLLRAVADWADIETGRHEPGGWAERFARLLRAAGWPKGRDLKADEHQAIDAWNRLLDVFAACGQVAGTLSRSEARRLLATMAREQVFLSENRVNGVQILSPEDSAGLTFDGLWIAGMTSDAWPPAARPNPVIPLDLQRQAGIPASTPQCIRRHATATMHRLFCASPEVYASWPDHNERGKLVRSPLLDDLDEIDGSKIETHAGESARTRLFAQRRLEILADDPAPRLSPGAPTRGGSRLMKLQAACPARAFFECRLGAREIRVPGFGINPIERGNIAHDALELLYGKIRSAGGVENLDAGQRRDLIAECSEAAMRKSFAGRDAFGRVTLRIEEVRLRSVIEKLVDFDSRREPFAIEGTEESVEVSVGPLRLKLRQDRVDRVKTGARLVIDYKTGAGFSINRWRGKRPAEPQLPLYAATAAVDGIAIFGLNGGEISVYGVAAQGVGLDFLKGPEAVFDGEPADWEHAVAGWRDAFERLATEYAAGDVRIDRNDAELAEGEFAMLTRIYASEEGGQQ